MTNAIEPRAKARATPDAARAAGVYETLRRTRPATRADLKNYVKVFLDIGVPDRRICPDHSSPMDYLWHSLSMDDGLWMKDDSNSPPSALNHPSSIIHHQSRDSIVWANRAGGGKHTARWG